MSVFSHPEFDGHETVVFHEDKASGLKAIIAVHNTHLGPGLGGCRMWPYNSDAEALTDVLRLSRGMTYKAALAGLPLGGAKSVVIGDPRKDKSPEMMQAMGQFVESLSGKYIVAEDSGISVADVRMMASVTQHFGGLADETAALKGRTGDPSPATALGVFYGIQAAVKHRLGRDNLQGLRVAIQGVGNVGFHLAKHLHAAGAKLWVADLHAPAVERCVKDFGAKVVSTEHIHSQDVDVYAPCALGAVLNDETIPQLKACVVAGAANNQLARPEHGHLLHKMNVLYAPDYVINAGGVIDVFHESLGAQWDYLELDGHLQNIGATLSQIFVRSEADSSPTFQIADEMARAVIASN